MNGRDQLTCLQFNDDDVFNQKVDSITDLKVDRVVDDWQRHLSLDTQASFSQFVEQTRFIGTLKKAWPER
jgi:hypothetical protein